MLRRMPAELRGSLLLLFLVLTCACSDTREPDAGTEPDAGAEPDAGVEPCPEGFEVCDTGCCEVDVGVVTLATGARSPSIAVSSTRVPHVSFLVNHYELMYAELGAAGWEIAPIGIDEENEYATAIALDGSDRPMVAFEANYAIKLARSSGTTWSHEDVYLSSQGYGPAVYQQGLVIDSTGAPHLAVGQEYYQSTTYGARVMHFTRDGAAWQRTDLVEYGDNRISLPSIAIADDVLHVSWVSYYDSVLHYATTASGSWVSEDASLEGYCCESSFVALAPDGTPRVAFENDTSLLLADRSSGAWSAAPLVTPLGAGKVGSVAVDSAGAVHYVYVNDMGQLVYVAPDGGAGVVVDEAVLELMMVLDASDDAHVVYTTDAGLYYARY